MNSIKRIWLLVTVLLCTGSITLSCVWLVAPARLAAQSPITRAQDGSYYQLCDQGGYLTIFSFYEGECIDGGTQTDILVNLLCEEDALRIKAGLRIADADTLAAALAIWQAAQGN